MLASDTLFEVDDKGISYAINLASKSCDCGGWSVSGIPCKHMLPCMMHNGLKMCDIVNDFFKKETYVNVYGGMIYPLLDKSSWPCV